MELEEHFTLLTPITHVFHEMFETMASRYNQLRTYNSRATVLRKFGSLSIRQMTQLGGMQPQGRLLNTYTPNYNNSLSLSRNL